MLELFLALFPFMLISYLLLVRSVRADAVMFLAYLSTVAAVLFVWNFSVGEVVRATGLGVLLAVQVILIVLAVLLLFTLLKQRGSLEHLERFFLDMSSEPRVHVVLMGFFFVTFLEGIAGFGVPALIVAPLLVLVGVPKLTAIVLTLLADSIAVAFGAFGTPFIVGLAGFEVLSVAQMTGVILGVLWFFGPLILLCLYALLEGHSVRSVKPFLGLALTTGAISALVFVFVAWFLGPELPSVLASITGLLVGVVGMRLGVFGVRIARPRIRQALPALLSYGLIVFVLLVSRLDIFGFGSWLSSVEFLSMSLYHPGALLLLCFFLLLVLFRVSIRQGLSVFVGAFEKGVRVIITLLFTIMFVQVLLLAEIPRILASTLAGTGDFYLLFSPFIGALGSFVAGSATVSNLLLSAVQVDAAVLNGLPQNSVLTAQVLGAAAGNTIAIHNVLAVLAVVHVRDGLQRVLRRTGVAAVVFCLFSAGAVWIISLL